MCTQVSNMQVYLNRGVQDRLHFLAPALQLAAVEKLHAVSASLSSWNLQGLVVALALWCTYCTIAGEVQAASGKIPRSAAIVWLSFDQGETEKHWFLRFLFYWTAFTAFRCGSVWHVL